MMADFHLPVKPRTDIALLNGIAHILIRDGLIDRGYIDAHTEGFEDSARFVAAFTPEHVLSRHRPSVNIIETAQLYGNAKAAFIGWTMGVNHSTQGAVTVAAINNLALITGNIGRVGAAPFSITGQCNAMGTREACFTSGLPGYRKFDPRQRIALISHAFGISTSTAFPRRVASRILTSSKPHSQARSRHFGLSQPTLPYHSQITQFLKQALANSRVPRRSRWVSPQPPPVSLRTWCLPAAIWGEKEGTYTNSERRISKANAFVTPPGEARTDFDIFWRWRIGFNVKDEIFPGWTTTHDACLEWQRVSKGRMCDYSNFTWEQIEVREASNGAETASTPMESFQLQAAGPTCIACRVFPLPSSPMKNTTSF